MTRNILEPTFATKTETRQKLAIFFTWLLSSEVLCIYSSCI